MIQGLRKPHAAPASERILPEDFAVFLEIDI